MNIPGLGRFVVPEVVVSHFNLQEGDSVADLGAGSGFFLESLSKAVGGTGRVYACEIQRALVDKLGDYIRVKGLGNVDVLWSDIEAPGGTKIPDGALDAAINVNTFFQFENKSAALSEVHRILKTGGNFHLIDWQESFAGMGPAPSAVVTKETATDLAEENGFVLVREFPAGDHHYGLTFRAV